MKRKENYACWSRDGAVSGGHRRRMSGLSPPIKAAFGYMSRLTLFQEHLPLSEHVKVDYEDTTEQSPSLYLYSKLHYEKRKENGNP
ncbi:hypothetical protein E2C01_015739 [Portunus trituberculatus]|uniref:Uncharacterized protein n=1 Tax=Portunus trituberculatus TaxID=210409 RepID=A0A5B7DMQ1_PORTR|nr:hypothetical protein [Portunus trituberculatus]